MTRPAPFRPLSPAGRWGGLLLALLLLLPLAGCELAPPAAVEDQELPLTHYTHQATDALLSQLAANVHQQLAPLDRERPLLVASFVHLDQLDASSSLGRLMAEQVASRLSQQGYAVRELKLQRHIFVRKRAGEFILSREVGDVSRRYDAQAVVVGTYSVIDRRIYVTVKMVDPDGKVYAAHDFPLPRNRFLH